MVRRILACMALAAFLIPSALSAVTITKPEDFSPKHSLATIDFSLHGKLKTILEPYITEALEDALNKEEKESERLKFRTLLKKILAGDKIFVAGALPPEGIVLSIPVTEEEFSIFTDGLESETYGSAEIFNEANVFVTKAGGFMAFAPGQGISAIQKTLDLVSGSSTESLSANPDYAEVSGKLLSPRLLGTVIDYKQLSTLMGATLQNQGTAPSTLITDESQPDFAITPEQLTELLSMIGTVGISVADAPQGYRFNAVVKGNEGFLKEKGFSLNPGGNFTPALHKKLPSAPTMLYTASFNSKAQNESGKKMIKAMGLGNMDLNSVLGEKLGFDFNLMYDAFPKEQVFALQYKEGSPLPYFTVLGDVNGNKADGEKLMNELVKLITGALEKNNVPFKEKKIAENGGFLKVIIDVTKIENYDGPPFPQIELTFGVSDDGLFIASNYPGIENPANRTGITIPETGEVMSILNVSARDFWGYMDSTLAWSESLEGDNFAPPLDFYQGYYTALEKLYKWQGLTMTAKGTDVAVEAEGTVTIDNAKHNTYQEFMDDMQASDRDDDGISDYDEKYVYFTPAGSADSDGDGTEDFEELQKGFDPSKADERLFDDVGEEAYYTDEVSMLYQKGAIRGYSDGTFKPGQFVTRAEFATMVVNSFEEDTSQYLGVKIQFAQKKPPFPDVLAEDWHYPYVAKAYSAGFISGSEDPVTGKFYFRPNDNITRAEALAILNKASGAMNKNRTSVSCQTGTPFKDVSSADWYCDSVANGFELGVTTGKRPGEFAPNENIVRADAAIMIRRALEKDLENLEKGTDSLGDIAAPLAAPLGGLISK